MFKKMLRRFSFRRLGEKLLRNLFLVLSLWFNNLKNSIKTLVKLVNKENTNIQKTISRKKSMDDGP